MKSILKKIFTLLLLLLFFISLYFGIAYLLTFFPKKAPQNSLKKEKLIYLLYNPMHSEILFPIEEINLSKFPSFQNKKEGYIAFGWGDKETYLNTPTWDDLKLSTSLKALFLNTPTLLHLTYYRDIHPYQTKTISLTTQQQTALFNEMLKTLKEPIKKYRGYNKNDFFYDAKGSYNLWNTCNTFTGDKLRLVGVQMSYWTPLSQNVIDSLP